MSVPSHRRGGERALETMGSIKNGSKGGLLHKNLLVIIIFICCCMDSSNDYKWLEGYVNQRREHGAKDRELRARASKNGVKM